MKTQFGLSIQPNPGLASRVREAFARLTFVFALALAFAFTFAFTFAFACVVFAFGSSLPCCFETTSLSLLASSTTLLSILSKDKSRVAKRASSAAALRANALSMSEAGAIKKIF